MKIEEFIEQYHEISLPDSAWLSAVRDNAAAEFEEIRFPALKDENWKYTRANNFLKDQFKPANEAGHLPEEKLAKYLLTAGEHLVFIDGVYSAEHSKNTVVKIFSAAWDSPLVKEYLTKIAPNKASGFVALNTMMMNDGYLLHIDKIIDQPIQVLHINTGRKVISHQRNLIVLEAHSQATIIENYLHLEDNKYFNNIVTEIVLQANAKLALYKIQQESLQAQHLSNTYVQQHRDSHLQHFNIDLGSQHARHWLQTNLNQENASCKFDGLYLVDEEQHIDNHTRIEHNAAHTFSQEHYKGILTGKCRGVFNGQVYIAKDSQKVVAEQQNANLLLDQGSEIDTKPQLEIYADDVKCSHGATIGQLSQDALFYLQTRGISEAMARNMLTYGFAYEMIAKIPYQPLKDYLAPQLLSWLPNGRLLLNLL